MLNEENEFISVTASIIINEPLLFSKSEVLNILQTFFDKINLCFVNLHDQLLEKVVAIDIVLA